MVSALVPRSSGPGSNPGQGRCVVFLGKTKLNSPTPGKLLPLRLTTQKYSCFCYRVMAKLLDRPVSP